MILTNEQIEQLLTILKTALGELYNKDKELIDRAVNERDLAFRLGLHMNPMLQINEQLKNLDLDIDYNKNGDEPKRTPRRPKGAVPDLIIHKRGNNISNTLVVEIKGWWNKQERKDDFIKLEDFTHQDGEYKYGLGVFVELGKDNFSMENLKGY